MAKMTRQTARKEYVCKKCGRAIHKGEVYFKIEEMYRPTVYRCSDCKPERSELTSSEYLAWLYNLQDHCEELFDLDSVEGKDELYSEIENMKDDLESRRDDMPEQLQEVGSGEILGNRIESLESCMDELDCMDDYPDEDDQDADWWPENDFRSVESYEFDADADSPDWTDEQKEEVNKLFVDLDNYHPDEETAEDMLVNNGWDYVDGTDPDADDKTYVNDETGLLLTVHYTTLKSFDEQEYTDACDEWKEQILDAINNIEE